MSHSIKYKKHDDQYTPSYALNPIYPFLDRSWSYVDPACGQNHIINAMKKNGFNCSGSDIKQGVDFLTLDVIQDCIITNPPFSLKNEFLKRCIETGKPFLLLMPSTTLETKERIQLIVNNDITIIASGKRIAFIDGDDDKVRKSPHGECFWFTKGLSINKPFAKIVYQEMQMKEEIINFIKVSIRNNSLLRDRTMVLSDKQKEELLNGDYEFLNKVQAYLNNL